MIATLIIWVTGILILVGWCVVLASCKDKPWEADFDKKTKTFDKLYVGTDRRKKNRDVDIEYIKVNGVDYTSEVDGSNWDQIIRCPYGIQLSIMLANAGRV